MLIALLPSLLPGLLDDGKDPGYFALQAGKFRRQNRSPGMQHYVDVSRQQGQVQAHRLAHAALDAIALHRFAENPPGSQANARTGGRSRVPLGEEICHGARKVFAAPLIHALIVSVLAQPSVVLRWKAHPIVTLTPQDSG